MTKIAQFREHIVSLLFRFFADFLADGQLANRAMPAGMVQAPANVAVPDVVSHGFGIGHRSIQICHHRLTKVLLQKEVKLVDQIIFGCEIAKQRQPLHCGLSRR